MSKQYHHI